MAPHPPAPDSHGPAPDAAGPAPDGRAVARAVAEAAREEQGGGRSLAAGIFLGRLWPAAVFPFPEQDPADRARAEPVLEAIERALREHLDPEEAERARTLPDAALKALFEAGAFRLKIPEAYGGLGFGQVNYCRAVAMVASWCNSAAIWMSGHQSIGLSTPLRLFGTPAQKAAYLPRLAGGALSAFALTEPEAGSDPARMRTRADPAPDGSGWILNGEKLWCTNGPVADLIVVMALTPAPPGAPPGRPRISAFIVETAWEGCSTGHRCDFAGYGAIHSGLLRFRDVRVPAGNLLWEEGQGLKLALITLNTGRLTLPATNTAVARQCLGIVRQWCARRVQWGAPIGAHEAVGAQVGWMAAQVFAMEAITDYAAGLVDRGGADVRLEAAIAKLFCSEAVFEVADRTLQLRGGRGYETAASLRARGEEPWPVERLWREARLNRIVEGTSEILRLFLAREALDPHLRRAGALLDPRAPRRARLGAGLRLAVTYPLWYLRRWIPDWRTPAGLPRGLRRRWRALERGARRLARQVLYGMVRFGPGLEHRQMLLGRLVDEGVDLTVMAAVLARAASRGDPASARLADLFCRTALARSRARRRTPVALDRAALALGREVLAGAHLELEAGILAPASAPAADPSPGR